LEKAYCAYKKSKKRTTIEQILQRIPDVGGVLNKKSLKKGCRFAAAKLPPHLLVARVCLIRRRFVRA